jgi:hypothetical protein
MIATVTDRLLGYHDLPFMKKTADKKDYVTDEITRNV